MRLFRRQQPEARAEPAKPYPQTFDEVVEYAKEQRRYGIVTEWAPMLVEDALSIIVAEVDRLRKERA